MEWIAKIIEVLKLPTKFIFILFISSLLILFLPKDILNLIKLDEFSNKFGLYIGISIIVTGTILSIETILFIWNWFSKKSKKKNHLKNIDSRLKQLDNNEKAILREFYLQGKNTIDLPIDNPTVAGLINSGILSYVSRQGRMSMAGTLFPLKISTSVSDNIEPIHIDLPNEELSAHEIQFFKKNRPNFISSIARENNIFGR